jgi:hypothetical protein
MTIELQEGNSITEFIEEFQGALDKVVASGLIMTDLQVLPKACWMLPFLSFSQGLCVEPLKDNMKKDVKRRT